MTAIRHDADLASSDGYIRDEAVARIVDQYQGDVMFCDHPECDLYTTDFTNLIRTDSGFMCSKHR